MSTPSRQLALRKRVSLAHLFEGNDACFAIVRPATRTEYKEMMYGAVSKLKPREQLEMQTKFVKEHFVSGKILALDSDGKEQIADLEPDDIDHYVDFSNALYIKIMGLHLDPKDL